jgi:4-diphosphocytidyl-2-C-methyl-D-erythritol kinase
MKEREPQRKKAAAMNEARVVIEKAHAKINLFLNVVGKRPDGYHELEMFNDTIDLFDSLIFKTKGRLGVQITSNDRFLENGNNLLTHVAEDLLGRYAPESGVWIEIEKRIPAGAGLGGNSADAAAVIRGIDRLFQLNLSNIEKQAIALRHGADIPYCLTGGPAFVRGLGERIEPVRLDLSGWGVLVAHPDVFVSTANVFAAWDRTPYPRVASDRFVAAVHAGDVEGMASAVGNALEPATFEIAPEVRMLKKMVVDRFGANGVTMTGSGSTILKMVRLPYDEIVRFSTENTMKQQIFLSKFTTK